MRNEIKLSLKDARKRGEKVGNQPAVITSAKNEFGQPIIEPGRGGEELDLEPTRGWTQAPDLAMLKSRPVDPPRKRDYAKLTEAAKRKDAPFVDWNGPSSDPTIKHAGDEVHRLAIPYTTSDDLPAHAPAPVADGAVGEFEPVGTEYQVGDTVKWPHESEPYPICGKSGDYFLLQFQGSGYARRADEMDRDHVRILKRKNVAARAWKTHAGDTYLKINGEAFARLYSQSNVPSWGRDKFDEDWPECNACWSKVEDPAEIQRLVAELHAAGLGK